MAIPELEKLAENEREDFVTLFHMRPFQMTIPQREKWEYFQTKVDVNRYHSEWSKEEASKPKEMLCTIISRNPYVISTNYGDQVISNSLVPEEIRNFPGDRYLKDTIYADVAVDIERKIITHFNFKKYLEKMTSEELKEFWDRMPTTKSH